MMYDNDPRHAPLIGATRCPPPNPSPAPPGSPLTAPTPSKSTGPKHRSRQGPESGQRPQAWIGGRRRCPARARMPPPSRATFLQAQEEFAPTTSGRDAPGPRRRGALGPPGSRAGVRDQSPGRPRPPRLDRLRSGPLRPRRLARSRTSRPTRAPTAGRSWRCPRGSIVWSMVSPMLLEDMNGAAAVWTPAHHKRLDALFGYRVG